MTKKVRCISPHGGAHNGMRHDGTAVHRLPNGDLPAVDPESLRCPPNERGYIDCPSLSRDPIAVGSVIDVPDAFIADGFHFEDVTPAPPPPAAPPAPAAPSAPAAPGEGK